MILVNCTPHDINLYLADGFVIALESRCVARAKQTNRWIGNADLEGSYIPIVAAEYGEPIDLPDPEDGTLFIVSALTAAAAPDRKDLVGTTDLVRDEAGRIIGAKALVKFNN